MKNEILRMEHVTTIRNEMTMLDNFSIHIFEGEIMGLVCINENGKESLIELISRNVPIHYGRVYFNESLVNNYQHSTMTMNKAAVIEQKSRLIEDLTVADNVFVLRRGFRKYWIHPRVLNDQLRRFTAKAGISLGGGELAADLSAFDRCAVELLRAVVMGARLIVIRDISNAVSAVDLARFHDLLRYYCKKGFSFLYICNHHEEAFRICTRISIMRDGKILKVFDKPDFSENSMAPYYARSYADVTPKEFPPLGKDPVLSFRAVSTANLNNVDFSIPRGQCTVLFDTDSTSLPDIEGLMKGDLRVRTGEIQVCGKPFPQAKARRGIANGVVFIEENPVQSMIFPQLTYLKNLCFLIGEKKDPVPLSRRILKSVVQEYEPLVGPDIHETNLSNLRLRSLYNLVYCRVHLCNPALAFCVNPFAGADMDLRCRVIELIDLLKKRGITVVIPSVNIADSLVIADRLILLEKGGVAGDYPRSDFPRLRSWGIIPYRKINKNK